MPDLDNAFLRRCGISSWTACEGTERKMGFSGAVVCEIDAVLQEEGGETRRAFLKEVNPVCVPSGTVASPRAARDLQSYLNEAHFLAEFAEPMARGGCPLPRVLAVRCGLVKKTAEEEEEEGEGEGEGSRGGGGGGGGGDQGGESRESTAVLSFFEAGASPCMTPPPPPPPPPPATPGVGAHKNCPPPPPPPPLEDQDPLQAWMSGKDTHCQI